jgi:hypothetical protein
MVGSPSDGVSPARAAGRAMTRSCGLSVRRGRIGRLRPGLRPAGSRRASRPRRSRSHSRRSRPSPGQIGSCGTFSQRVTLSYRCLAPANSVAVRRLYRSSSHFRTRAWHRYEPHQDTAAFASPEAIVMSSSTTRSTGCAASIREPLRRQPTSCLNSGSSRIGSRSESSAASERSRSRYRSVPSSASRRWPSASDVRPARLSQHARL